MEHGYDPEGLRSWVNENGHASHFVYDGWNLISELDGEHQAKTSYVRGHELLAQVNRQGDSYYYLNNEHGDVVRITNRLGGILNSYEYDAFGQTVSATEAIPNRFRYAGEQFDAITQQYYLRARFYNPVIAVSRKRTSTVVMVSICMHMSGTIRLITWIRAVIAARMLVAVAVARRKGRTRGR